MFLANLCIFSGVSLKQHLVLLGILANCPLVYPLSSHMTFDPRNALHSNQVLFVPNLVDIEHFYVILPLVDICRPLDDLRLQQCVALTVSQ